MVYKTYDDLLENGIEEEYPIELKAAIVLSKLANKGEQINQIDLVDVAFALGDIQGKAEKPDEEPIGWHILWGLLEQIAEQNI